MVNGRDEKKHAPVTVKPEINDKLLSGMTDSESDGGVGVWRKSHGRSMRTCADNKRNGESWCGDGVEQAVSPLINRA